MVFPDADFGEIIDKYDCIAQLSGRIYGIFFSKAGFELFDDYQLEMLRCVDVIYK